MTQLTQGSDMKEEKSLLAKLFDPTVMLDEQVKLLHQYKQRSIDRALLEEAKLYEHRAGKKFDELCERVRSDPNFGNSSKGKKDNFLDGAESMLLIPSIRRAELEQQLSPTTTEGEDHAN